MFSNFPSYATGRSKANYDWERGTTIRVQTRTTLTYESFLSHETSQLPSPVHGIPLAEHQFELVGNGCFRVVRGVTAVEDELGVEVVLDEV